MKVSRNIEFKNNIIYKYKCYYKGENRVPNFYDR